MLVIFEVCSFNRFGAIAFNAQKFRGSRDPPVRCTDSAQCAHTDTQTETDKTLQTHIERTHYLRHSLRSLGGDNKQQITEVKAHLLDEHHTKF